MNLLSILLQAPAPKGGGSMTLIFILLIIVVFYFFMIRPQQKQQKKVAEFRQKLQKGDKVTTVGGIRGKIKEVREETFLIEVANDVCIEIEKGGIAVDQASLKDAK